MTEATLWADVRCPWCWVGLRQVSEVLRGRGEFRLRHRAFLLEPDGPQTAGRPLAEVAVGEWGMDEQQWRDSSGNIRAAGESAGVQINVDSSLTFDSRPVHRMLKFVMAAGVPGATAWEAAFDAHFRRNLDLGRPEVIGELAAALGVGGYADGDPGLAAEVLADHRDAVRRGVRAVPSILVGDQLLAGSHSVTEIAEFLDRQANSQDQGVSR